MLLIPIDRSSDTPVYKQICRRIAALVEEGSLKPGSKLPTSRRLATAIGAHRSTVVRAYDECRALGYLESTPGSYTRVRKRGRVPMTGPASRSSVIDWNEVMLDRLPGMMRLSRTPAPWNDSGSANGLIDFDTLSADPSLAPDPALRRCVRQALLGDRTEVLDYTDPAGWRPFRISIAKRLQLHGMSVSADEVLITNGAQQALDLILRLLVQPGDRVAVESPTYGVFQPLARLHGIRPVEVPMTPEGMDLDLLEESALGEGLKLVYTMPNFQNPMGITTDQAHRERLMDICESARVPVIEDGFEEEMKYFGKAVMPLKSLDSGGIVFYVGSFSKVVFSGLRVGWIAAPVDAVEGLASIQQASCLSVNTLMQAALERFCADGQFDVHLRRMHNIYRRRMQVLLRGLNEHLPPGAVWTRPAGGYTLWLTLPESAGSESALLNEFNQAGVAIAPGKRFFMSTQRLAQFRISIACVEEQAIEEGCRRLGRVLLGKDLSG